MPNPLLFHFSRKGFLSLHFMGKLHTHFGPRLSTLLLHACMSELKPRASEEKKEGGKSELKKLREKLKERLVKKTYLEIVSI